MHSFSLLFFTPLCHICLYLFIAHKTGKLFNVAHMFLCLFRHLILAMESDFLVSFSFYVSPSHLPFFPTKRPFFTLIINFFTMISLPLGTFSNFLIFTTHIAHFTPTSYPYSHMFMSCYHIYYLYSLIFLIYFLQNIDKILSFLEVM